ncbi:HAD family hydrolase [Sulfoacidibacillus thermotolerans]|uniref:HAD family hydrolase n=1 Tax=Sulfoacidibacillus thermotolerans TaxID=1765684 RepID=UPI0015E820DC|nr:HAD family hydrolase [Sulfoacidibacillus thermotolerans]
MSKQLWLFDMDGTLFETERVAIPAFHEVFVKLRSEGLEIPEKITDKQITGVFGYTHERIWAELFGRSLNQQEQALADELLLKAELELIAKGQGVLYPEVKETLWQLRELGASLAVASNGMPDYIAAIVDYFELRDFFVGLYTAGGYQVNS